MPSKTTLKKVGFGLAIVAGFHAFLKTSWGEAYDEKVKDIAGNI